MKSKCIAFSGTHGTGKSTQAYALATQLKLAGKNVILLDELARECPLAINKEASSDSHWWILCAQIKRELELKNKYEYIICDRTVIDTLAYARVLGMYIGEELFITYAKNAYDKILYLDHNAYNYQIDDGIRDMDAIFREEVAEALMNLVWNTDHIYVTEDSQIRKAMEDL